MNIFIEAFFFFLPAGLSNMAPVLINKVPVINRWNTPLDFGKSYKGERIFGQNKTWRGLVSGVVFAGIIASLVATFYYDASPDYFRHLVIRGMLMGFGALAGDAIESFFKRQSGIAAGSSWFPFDQTDYIVGGLVMSLFVSAWDTKLFLVVILEYFGLHLFTSYLAFKMKLKDKPI